MSIVISYAHEDSHFANRLAANLFKNRVPLWVDKWELKVGDSILRRIESAIQEADALIVVLSKASVQSEWCRKELTAGLISELEAKSIFVLPILHSGTCSRQPLGSLRTLFTGGRPPK